MNSNQQKADLLDAMGIPQWVSRGPAAGQSMPVAEEQLSAETQAGNVAQIIISGEAASGWLWLTEEAVTGKEHQLLSDIQLAVNCGDGGMLARADSSADDSMTLAAAIEAELITRLVVFGNRPFQELMSADLKLTSLAKVETLPLVDLEQSPTAKRQLWSDLKKLLVN